MGNKFFTYGEGLPTGEYDDNNDPILNKSKTAKFLSGSFSLGPLGSVGVDDAAGAIGKPLLGLLSQGMSSVPGALLSGAGDTISSLPVPGAKLVGAGLNMLSGATNALFGYKENTANIQAANLGLNSLMSANTNYTSFDDVKGPMSLKNYSKKDFGKEGLFSNHISHIFNDYKDERSFAEDFNDRSTALGIERLQELLNRNAFARLSAYGGYLSNGIKNWDTDLVLVNNGGTHELNPYEGVLMGVDREGTPNLVEEGEIIWDNNYVFSNRLKMPKYLLGKYGMSGKRELTFADLAKDFKNKREERPNDPITRATTERQLRKLQEDQELFKSMKESANVVTLGPEFDGVQTSPYDIYEGPMSEYLDPYQEDPYQLFNPFELYPNV